MGAQPTTREQLLPEELYPVTLYSDELEEILEALRQALAEERSLVAQSGLHYAAGVLSAALAQSHARWRRRHPTPSLLRRLAALLGARMTG
jgi:hypothetical protein